MRILHFKNYYDLVIVGGGIQGCALLWEAQSRGLKALLVEANDYCSQTSANSLKTIHGGIRYLQTLNLSRTIISAKEQETLLHIAPHLIQPLQCLLPTESKLSRSRLAITSGFILYNTIKQLNIKNQRLLKAQCLSKLQLSQQTSLFDNQAITGAGLWHDAQAYNSERLGLAFINSAQALGADSYNYLKADGLLFDQAKINSITLKDQLTNQTYQINTRHVINSCGGTTDQTLGSFSLNKNSHPFCIGINLVTQKNMGNFALGLKVGFAKNHSKENRLLFSAPWKHYTLFGTWYFPCLASQNNPVNPLQASPEQLNKCLEDINNTFPKVNLSVQDICKVHVGLLPICNQKGGEKYRLKEKNLIYQPSKPLKLFVVIPTKYTTCRAVAEQAINYLCKNTQLDAMPSSTASRPLNGGDINVFKDYKEKCKRRYQKQLPESAIDQLVHHYGSNINKLINLVDEDNDLLKLIPGSNNHVVAQLEYALRHEQAYQIDDLIYRRTALGSGAEPNKKTMTFCQKYLDNYFIKNKLKNKTGPPSHQI